jgi:DNA-binding NarL/FixJ family response regulator
LRTVTSELLQATLDALASGVYLVDREGHVVYMNPAAERQVRSGDNAQGAGQPGRRDAPGLHALLSREIEAAVREGARSVNIAHALALESNMGTGLVATVLPLHGNRRGTMAGPFAAAAAIFAQDPQRVPPLPGEAFAKIHGLTAGELRVLLAMAPGLSVKEASEMLGISEATSKTHLQRIFDKTGTSKQSELIRLLMSSAPPVRSH